MFDYDKWQEIFETIWQNKLRTAATAFGVFWGILMLVVLLGAGQGLQNGVLKESVADATNSVWFFTGQTSMPYRGRPVGRQPVFTEKDLEAIQAEIPGVEFMSPENTLQGSYNTVYKNKSGTFRMLGAGKDFFNIKIYQEYLAGRKLNLNDNLEGRKVCVIGDRVSEILFEPGEDPIGQYISVKGVMLKVVGLFHDDGWGGQFSERIYIPYSTFQRTFNPDRSVDLFAITSQEGYVAADLQAQILALLKERHVIHPDDEEAFWSHNQEENYNRIMTMFAGIKGFVWFVGISTLIAGIVGISNIMLIVVRERRKEFGIRKAIGATPYSIISLILQESILITTLAGYFGIVTGIGLLQGVNKLMEMSGANISYFLNPQVDITVIIAALTVLVIAGLLAGFFPALRAANVPPMEALRAE